MRQQEVGVVLCLTQKRLHLLLDGLRFMRGLALNACSNSLLLFSLLAHLLQLLRIFLLGRYAIVRRNVIDFVVARFWLLFPLFFFLLYLLGWGFTLRFHVNS